MTDAPAAPAAPADARLRGWRAAVLSAGLLVASLGVAVVIAEVGVRIVAPQQLIMIRPDIWRAVDTLGWTKRPGVNARINTGERWTHIVTDRDGFRVGTAGRIEGARTVLLLGDSFMEALQVEYEQSVAGLLEARLPARLGQRVAVRNTGVAGWDPPQYYFQARQVLARDTVDVVLVSIYLGNDVVSVRPDRIPPRRPTVIHRLRWPRSASWDGFVDAVLYPVNDWLKYRSHLYVLLKARVQTLRMRAGLTETDPPTHVLRSEAASPRWRVTAEICRDLAAEARAHGARTVFVLVPAPEQVDTALLSQYRRGFSLGEVDPDQPTALLGAALHGERLAVVDALPAFRQGFAEGTRIYGNVDRHLTPAGHELLARVIEPALIASLATPPARSRANRR